MLAKFTTTLRIRPYLFYTEKLITHFKKQKEMRGYRTRFRENDDLLTWRGPAVKKKPPFFKARALIKREITRSRDAQCSNGK